MIYLLDNTDPATPFPAVEQAETDPDGLLAVGGDLTPARLLQAYRQGVFPWFNEDQPILWWSPNPRTVLYPEQIRVSRSLTKSLRNRGYRITFDHAFSAVVDGCRKPAIDRPETWITDEMIMAYSELFQLGHAHSVEVWQQQRLVGGLYGIAIGRVFFGESMFSQQRDASKVALVHLTRQLQRWDFGLIDCQVNSAHLASLGAVEISRERFCRELEQLCVLPGITGKWEQLAAASVVMDQP